jgi:hypothetical protein
VSFRNITVYSQISGLSGIFHDSFLSSLNQEIKTDFRTLFQKGPPGTAFSRCSRCSRCSRFCRVCSLSLSLFSNILNESTKTGNTWTRTLSYCTRFNHFFLVTALLNVLCRLVHTWTLFFFFSFFFRCFRQGSV